MTTSCTSAVSHELLAGPSSAITMTPWSRRCMSGGALVALLFLARCHGGMDAHQRELPVGLVTATDTLLALSECCEICLCDVEEVETAVWLPACLHMFHRNCIDKWLHLHGHSTCRCPICRHDAFATPPLPL
ncbi:unnamed protein product [Urochloa humidicola]